MAIETIANPTQSFVMAQNLPDISPLTIAAPLPGKKGSIRHGSVLLNDKPFRMILGSSEKPLRVPFEVKPFNDTDSSTRLNLHLSVTDPTVEQYFEELDQNILKIVEANSNAFFNKELSLEHLKMMYRPILPENGSYDKNLKCKVNLENPRKLRVWNEDKEPMELPSEWKDLKVCAAIAINSMYFASNMFGVVLEATDVMLCSADAMDVCPF